MKMLASGRFGWCAVLALALPALGLEQTQTVALQGGWNAVWLEVTPTDPAPAAVFAGTPVDVVAAYYPASSTVQFLTDPGETPWQQSGWGVWYAAGRPEAAVGTLATLDGGRAYLVHAANAANVAVRGEAVCLPLRWYANSLNFVGLPVDPEAPPTFGEYFAGSAAHQSLRVYRLLEGKWRLLASPSTTAVARGTAYWIQCSGRSDWQGPLEVSLKGISGVNFGSSISTVEVRLLNGSGGPLAATLERLSGDLPLCLEQLDPETLALSYPGLAAAQSLGVVEAGAAATLRLQVRRELMNAASQEAVLCVRGGGCQTVIPVSALRGTP